LIACRSRRCATRPEEHHGADPLALFGYGDPSAQPEATGVEKLVLKRGNLFLVANRMGDLTPSGARDLGLFLTDTRHLSAWKLAVKGGPPLCLSTQVSPDYVSQVDFTITSLHVGDLLGKEPVNFLHLRRDQIIDGDFVDRLLLTNFLDRPIDYWIELEWACDFADVFEVRGARRGRRGRYHAPAVEGSRVVLRYDGLDGRTYATEIEIHDAAERRSPVGAWIDRLEGGGARIAFHLEPREGSEVSFIVRASQGEAPRRRTARPFGEIAAESAAAYAQWSQRCTRFSSSNALLDHALEQGVADLKALTVYHFDEPVISAGIPWYTCPFGRDALITGFQALLATPEVARQALRFLARLQGQAVDPARDEEPGKIPHEIRFGEMALAGEVPHTPYYGSVDATPLFLVLLSEYFQWTADRATVDELMPAADAALAWVEQRLRTHGEGFLDYERQAPRGLRNQGWKDSHDGVPFADGTPAETPIALVEVQGYALDALRRMAELHAQLGRASRATDLLAASGELSRGIEERFFLAGKSTYAIALDGAGRQVDAVTSNPGHLLFSRAIANDRARLVADSLLSRDMWSGWGIRTLASGQKAYNPLSYHNGTVWPHDNSLAAMGMAYYGLTDHATQVFEGLWAAAQHFRHLRMPELFCGLDRSSGQFPVHYPVACSPQAWASGAWFLLLRGCLGIYADAPRSTLRIVSPRLPAGVEHLTLRGVRVGPSRATLEFTRGSGGGAFVAVNDVEGPPLHVRIDLLR
jgi:glycogen debranching enzyme